MNNLINQLHNLAKCVPTFGPVLKELSEEIDKLESEKSDLLAKLVAADMAIEEQLQEIERLRKEVAKLRKATVWQPIETVPSGDVILYYPKQTGRNALSEWIRTGTSADTPRRKPTHWFPIPKPPATEGGE